MFTGKKVTASLLLVSMMSIAAPVADAKKKIILKPISAFTGEAAVSITGEAVASTGEAKAKPAAPVVTKIFSDVDIGSPFYVQLSFLKKENLIKGYSDGSFKPNAPINRAEAAAAMDKILLNFDLAKDLTKGEENYTDLTKDNWAFESVQKLAKLGIAKGVTKKTTNKKTKVDTTTVMFKPSDKINLAEAVKMVIGIEMLHDNTLKLPTDKKSSFKDVKGTEWFAPYIELANQKTLLSYGMSQKIVAGKEMTRGELMDLLYRALKTREAGHFFGKGTFYSDSFEGRGTSNGEKYTQSGYTAAHRTLPFNTNVLVTYMKNAQQTTVRINDRGPFTASLDLDMTKTAFSVLANPSEGIVPIEYQIVTK